MIVALKTESAAAQRRGRSGDRNRTPPRMRRWSILASARVRPTVVASAAITPHCPTPTVSGRHVRRLPGESATRRIVPQKPAPNTTVPSEYANTYLMNVLRRVGEQPGSRVVELTPRVWKTPSADDPLRSGLAWARDPPSG